MKILPCRPLTAVTSRHEPICSPGVGTYDISHSPMARGPMGPEGLMSLQCGLQGALPVLPR